MANPFEVATQHCKLVVPLQTMAETALSAAADAQLVELATRGQASEQASANQAYALLVTRHEGMVRRFLYYLTRQSSLADDLAQDAFFTAWQKLPTLRDGEKFASWIKQLAYRRFLHYLRRQKLEREHLRQEAEREEPSVAADEQFAELDQLRELLAHCSRQEQELLVLVYAFGFTVAEVAAAQEMPEGTVKSILHRAKSKMQATLAIEQTATEQTDALPREVN